MCVCCVCVCVLVNIPSLVRVAFHKRLGSHGKVYLPWAKFVACLLMLSFNLISLVSLIQCLLVRSTIHNTYIILLSKQFLFHTLQRDPNFIFLCWDCVLLLAIIFSFVCYFTFLLHNGGSAVSSSIMSSNILMSNIFSATIFGRHKHESKRIEQCVEIECRHVK